MGGNRGGRGGEPEHTPFGYAPAMRRTLADSIDHEGHGVHTGARCSATVFPGEQGLRIGRDRETLVPLGLGALSGSSGATSVNVPGGSIGMIEHLLGGLALVGVTDADIVVSGPEVPILDGSGLPWFQAAERVGMRALGLDEPIRPPELAIEAYGGRASVKPASRLTLEVSVDYGLELAGRARLRWDDTVRRRVVASARTFALRRDVERLLASRRGVGATIENTVIYGPSGAEQPERMVHEGAWHKLLDLVGDLVLLGRPIRGHIKVDRGSHALHHLFVRTLVDRGAS